MLGVLEIAGVNGRTPLVWVVASLFFLSGAGLIVGFLTPLSSLLLAVCVLVLTLSWVPSPGLASLGVMLSLLIIVTAIGIALLGPGAFSLDGYLFGRREIVIPPNSPEL